MLLDGVDGGGVPPTDGGRDASRGSAAARSFLQLAACSLGWMRAGDEALAQGVASSVLLAARWLRRADLACTDAPDAPALLASFRPALLSPLLQLLRLPKTAQAEAQACAA